NRSVRSGMVWCSFRGKTRGRPQSQIRRWLALQTLFVVAATSSQIYAILQVRTSRTRTRKPPMSIDFEIPAEAQAIRERVRQWVQDECIPAEKELDTRPLDEVLGKLRKKARAQGL